MQLWVNALAEKSVRQNKPAEKFSLWDMLSSLARAAASIKFICMRRLPPHPFCLNFMIDLKLVCWKYLEVKEEELRDLDQNIELKEQLNLHQKQVELLKKEKNLMLQQNKNYKLNLSVNREGILEYQAVNQKQL